jgi:DNA-3-methyladenine glycosylase II
MVAGDRPALLGRLYPGGAGGPVGRAGTAHGVPCRAGLAPQDLRALDLDLPGRKSEYLRAVAEAALEGLLDGGALRALDPDQAIQRVQQVKGLGPFAAELVVVRGANAPDALPRHERRLDAEVPGRYGPGHTLAEVSQAWRPYRTWAAVHLRALRGQRTGEITGR